MSPVPVPANAVGATLRMLVEQRPSLLWGVIIGAGGVAVLAAGAMLTVWITRRVRDRLAEPPPGERLWQVLADHDAVAVLMHPDPDPDAMGAALGVAHLAATAGTDATVHYPGEIRHQENRAFRAVLDTDFERIERAADLPSVPVVLVDHNTVRGLGDAERLDPLAVVDHHHGEGSGTEFTDVRPDCGSTSTIVTEYFRTLGFRPAVEPAAVGDIPVDPGTSDAAAVDPAGSNTLPPQIATALLCGVRTDTADLTRGCSSTEYDCCAYLHPGVDRDALARIADPPMDPETLEIRARTVQERVVRSPVAVSDVGPVSNVDAIPQAADELLRLEGVTTAVVFGQKDGTYHLSARSRDDRVHVGMALERAVDGRRGATAGGHARMGGGQIPVGTRQSDAGAAPLLDRLFDVMQGKLA